MSRAWEIVKGAWSWVAWVWNGYEGLVHDYPRAAAIVFAAYIVLTLVF